MSHTAEEHRAELVDQLVADIKDERIKAQCRLDVLCRLERAIEEAQQLPAERTRHGYDPRMIDEAIKRAMQRCGRV